VGAKFLRKDDAAVPVDRENLDITIERDRELIPLIRIVRQAAEKPIDLLRSLSPPPSSAGASSEG